MTKRSTKTKKTKSTTLKIQTATTTALRRGCVTVVEKEKQHAASKPGNEPEYYDALAGSVAPPGDAFLASFPEPRA